MRISRTALLLAFLAFSGFLFTTNAFAGSADTSQTAITQGGKEANAEVIKLDGATTDKDLASAVVKYEPAIQLLKDKLGNIFTDKQTSDTIKNAIGFRITANRLLAKGGNDTTQIAMTGADISTLLKNLQTAMLDVKDKTTVAQIGDFTVRLNEMAAYYHVDKRAATSQGSGMTVPGAASTTDGPNKHDATAATTADRNAAAPPPNPAQHQ